VGLYTGIIFCFTLWLFAVLVSSQGENKRCDKTVYDKRRKWTLYNDFLGLTLRAIYEYKKMKVFWLASMHAKNGYKRKDQVTYRDIKDCQSCGERNDLSNRHGLFCDRIETPQ